MKIVGQQWEITPFFYVELLQNVGLNHKTFWPIQIFQSAKDLLR